MKKTLFILGSMIAIGSLGWLIKDLIVNSRAHDVARAEAAAHNEAVDRVLGVRRKRLEAEVENGSNSDPIGEDQVVRVLLIGLDKRVGQTSGHCDVIQMIEINTKKQEVTITAVPRGTYSPLPPGMGVTTSDYYVSNACGLAGIEYGINQIEKILGMKADYLVIVGFSETLGILRTLKLPTTETLQWLRQRHVYSIGEPQRAHNHSTFLKQMMIKYLSDTDISKIDTALHYIVYKIVKTDLSFDEAEAIVQALVKIDISKHPERIRLSMRPAHSVADIPYVPEELTKYLEKTLNPIKNYLSKNDFSGSNTEEVQKGLLQLIDEKKNNKEFIVWAYENNLWLQIEDDPKRLEFEYECIEKYVSYLDDVAEKKTLVSDYILEMEHQGEEKWKEKGKQLLAQILEKK